MLLFKRLFTFSDLIIFASNTGLQLIDDILIFDDFPLQKADFLLVAHKLIFCLHFDQ